MIKTLHKELTLVITFLAIIITPGIIQTALELRGGEPPQALNVFRQKISSKNLRAYERELEDASWVARQLRPVMQYAQFQLLHEAGDKALVGRDGWMFYKPGFRYLTERPAPSANATLTNTPRAAIVAFRDALAKRNIRLLVLIAPNKESIYPEMVTRRAAGLDVLVCSQTRRLLDDLHDAGVEVVDLFETYRAAKHAARPGLVAPLYLVQDSHWSPAGVEVAAKAVAGKILGAGWVQSGGAAYEAKPMPVSRVGDVIRMLQIPQLEQGFTPESILCQQIVRRDSPLPYQDDPESDILVLGDSFLRIYEQDEPKSAGFVAHLAHELRQPVTSIINDGGASTLVRQELHRRPKLLAHKKVVVWEFVERDIRFGTEGWQVVPVPIPVPSPTAAARPDEAKRSP